MITSSDKPKEAIRYCSKLLIFGNIVLDLDSPLELTYDETRENKAIMSSNINSKHGKVDSTN